MKHFLALLILGFVFATPLISQNVNKVVDKNDLDEEMLISLIIERVNEVRAFKSLGELDQSEICRLAAHDHASYISLQGELLYEQDKEGMETTIDRVLAYGAQKKSKVAENIHRIEIDPTFTYVDLSDEIASAWLMDKKANKNIEGKGHFVYGIGLAVLPEEEMLYVALVFGNDAIGSDVKYPMKEEVAEKEVKEDESQTENQDEQGNGNQTDSGESPDLNSEETPISETQDTDKQVTTETVSPEDSGSVESEEKTDEE